VCPRSIISTPAGAVEERALLAERALEVVTEFCALHDAVLRRSAYGEIIDLTDDEEIVAVCVRGRSRQPIRLLELPLPDPPPDGAEWIEAYRRWARGR
jgi:hypothetical protein